MKTHANLKNLPAGSAKGLKVSTQLAFMVCWSSCCVKYKCICDEAVPHHV